MSLVYNNDKPIGKCESYSIDKIPGTTPFVMLTNYEPLRSELNPDQQIVLEWLKEYTLDDSDFRNAIFELNKLYSAGFSYKKEEIAFKKLNDRELAQVLAAFAEWGIANAEE
ncbi:hypothetical protein [Enterococcus viikkiensis]|uniref:hypothetical protein n=1 Tax=Enterococcus viikkiensis TaxID=930854 RepID=UPI0010F7C79F|nr:hypothetical protein [Enterococcus viikkiensis]